MTGSHDNRIQRDQIKAARASGRLCEAIAKARKFSVAASRSRREGIPGAASRKMDIRNNILHPHCYPVHQISRFR